MKWSSLQQAHNIQRLMAKLVIGIMVPISIVGLFGMLYGHRTLDMVANQNAQTLSELKGNIIATWIKNKKSEIEGIASSDALRQKLLELQPRATTQEKYEKMVKELNAIINDAFLGREYSSFRNIAVIDIATAGIVAYAPENENIAISHLDKIVSGGRSKTTLMSRRDANNGDYTLYIASPIIVNNETRGVLFAEIDTSVFLYVFSNRSNMNSKHMSYLLDEYGNLIAPTDESTKKHIFLMQTAIENVLHKQTTEQSGIFDTQKEDGENIIIAYNTIPSDWILVTETPKEALLGIVDWPFLIALLIAFIVFSVFLAIINLRSLVNPLRNAIDRIARVGTSLSQTSQQVVTSAQNNAAIAEQVAHGAVTQSENANTISLSVAQILSGVNEMIDSSEKASQVAREVSQITQVAGERGERSQESLNQIRNMVTDTAIIARTTGTRSHEIRVIVDAMTKIAEQTNLLALNAAIEAARAGEAGRGFSVVADEIRKLAEQSASSADEIKQKVEAMLVQIEDTVLTAEKGLAYADENAKVVNESLQELQNISGSIQRLLAHIKEMSLGTQKQSSLIRHVEEGIGLITDIASQNSINSKRLSTSTQQQSAANQQVAAAAQQLQTLAFDLQQFTGGAPTSSTVPDTETVKIDGGYEHLETRNKTPIPAYLIDEKSDANNSPSQES